MFCRVNLVFIDRLIDNIIEFTYKHNKRHFYTAVHHKHLDLQRILGADQGVSPGV